MCTAAFTSAAAYPDAASSTMLRPHRHKHTQTHTHTEESYLAARTQLEARYAGPKWMLHNSSQDLRKAKPQRHNPQLTCCRIWSCKRN